MELLTIAEIAKRLELPESTVRYYRDRFSAYVPALGEGRNRRYRAEALEVLRFVAEAMRAGLPAEEVETALQARFPMTVVPLEAQQQPAAGQQRSAAILTEWLAGALQRALAERDEAVRQELSALRAELELARQQTAAAAEVLERLRQEAEQREEARRRREEERDRRLMEVLRSLQQRPPWWRRWLGR